MAGFDFKTEAAKLASGGVNGIPNSFGDVAGVVNSSTNQATNSFSNITNSSGAFTTDLSLGGTKNPSGGSQAAQTVNSAASTDFRVRLRAMVGQEDKVYGADGTSNILSILRETNGLMFPYTPAIEWSQQVEYSTTSLTHSNQDYQTYKSTPSTTFRVTGDFTIQNYREGRYALAVIHFLRTVSKMHFGASDQLAGMPPPVLLFSGYGQYMFNDLPVILKDHSFSLPKDMDYVDIMTPDGVAVRMPSMLTISMTLTVQNTPNKQRTEFNLDEFRTGQLMKKKGWI